MKIDDYQNLAEIISGSYARIGLDFVADSSVPDYTMFMVPESVMLDLQVQEAVIEQGVFSSRTKSESLKPSSDSNFKPNSPSVSDDYLFLNF